MELSDYGYSSKKVRQFYKENSLFFDKIYMLKIEETFNDEETEMICISAAKNDKGEIEMLMITDRYEHKYVIYNHSTNEITRVDENNIMSINKDLRNDLELYFLCNR